MNNTLLLLDRPALEAARERLNRGHIELTPAFFKLRIDADAALARGPWSVMDKKAIPPSGDKHDYMSLGLYWWPDPNVPGGEPYIRRDGEVNPLCQGTDREPLEQMSNAVETLSLAYYFTGDERYAMHASKLLRVWFLDEATRMNPHLEYGQAIPGRCTGRDFGVIDTLRLCKLPDAITILKNSQAWTETDDARVREWFSAYLRWLLDSAHGRGEADKRNNHGTWYDVQVATFALFAGQPEVTEEVLATDSKNRIAAQIEPDGSQPHELRRTRSFGYSVMNLRGFFHLATLAEHVEMDLWNFQTPDGRSLRRALDYLAPYAEIQVEWPYQQLGEDNRASLFPLLRQAAIKYSEPRYEAILAALPEELVRAERFNLLYPTVALLTPPTQ